MNNNKTNDGFLSAAIVIGAALLFSKTADVFTYFSPTILNDIAGFDVGIFYGVVTAGMVEGMILALHFNHRAALSGQAQWVKWILVGISGLCQFFDGAIVTETLAQQSPTLKVIFQFGVPVIPLLIVVMIIWIGALPDSPKQRKPWKGLKHAADQLPKIWHGEDYRPSQRPQKHSEKPATMPPFAPQEPGNAFNSDTGIVDELEETVNPTIRRNGKA